MVAAVKRLLHTPVGQMLISFTIGFGLATLFRKVCNSKDCIVYNGPVISEVESKVYQYGDTCYTYKSAPGACAAGKQTVDAFAPSARGSFRT
jgi:hypothetical protein